MEISSRGRVFLRHVLLAVGSLVMFFHSCGLFSVP